mgnify:CR=1 FL=1|jgi:hypothetical protein|nr:MAG TPA: hypothetical protein [Caudoviricetes sp.]
MCFKEDIKNKLIAQGYNLMKESVLPNGKTVFIFQNQIGKQLNFAKDEIAYTNKMLY